MKILVDDKRSKLPDGSEPDVIIRTFDAAFIVLSELGDGYALPMCHLYLDHDLGAIQADGSADDNATGYRLACTIEAQVLGADNSGWLPLSMTCVSDNGAGRARIAQVIEKIYTEVNRL